MNPTPLPPGSIVVGLDGSAHSAIALDWAVEQARLEHRPLVLVHAASPVDDLAREDLEQAGPDDLDVHRVTTEEDPREVLLRLSREAALIVVGHRGRGPVRTLLLGSVSVAVTRHAVCPVVVVRRASGAGQSGILLGVDGREESQPAVEFAYRMASARRLPLTVLHCAWDARQAAHPERTDAGPDDDAAALVAEAVAGMAEKYPDVETKTVLTHGFADRRIIELSDDVELVVVGSHPTTALSELVYGSVAPTVVEHARGNVAVVPARMP